MAKLLLKKEVIFIFLVLSFLFQGIILCNYITNIKLFMLAISLSCIYLITFHLNEVCCYLLRFIKQNIIIILFATYMISTSLWANNIDLSIKRSLSLILIAISIFITIILLRNANTRIITKILNDLLLAYLLLSLLYYVVGILNYIYFVTDTLDQKYFYGAYLEGNIIRMRGFTDSPNNFSYMLMVITYFNIISCNRINNALFILVLLCLFLSISITGMIVLMIPTLIFICNLSKNKRYILIGFCIFIASFIYVFYQSFEDFISYRIHRIIEGSGRWKLFYHSLTEYSDNPIWGYGIGQARVLLYNYKDGDKISTHNSFIEVYIEGGIIGLIMLLLCILFGINRIIKLDILKNTKIMLICFSFSFFLFNFSNLILYTDLLMVTLIIFIFLIMHHKKISNTLYSKL